MHDNFGFAFNPRLHKNIEVKKLEQHMPLQTQKIINDTKSTPNAPMSRMAREMLRRNSADNSKR